MKKRLLVAFVAICAVCATSCKKEATLKDTLGKCEMSSTQTIEGVEVAYSVLSTLTFSTETDAEMYIRMAASVAGMGEILNDESTIVLTYTYDGTKGTLTNVPTEAGEEIETINFTVEGDQLTIEEAMDGENLILTYTKQ